MVVLVLILCALVLGAGIRHFRTTHAVPGEQSSISSIR